MSFKVFNKEGVLVEVATKEEARAIALGIANANVVVSINKGFASK